MVNVLFCAPNVTCNKSFKMICKKAGKHCYLFLKQHLDLNYFRCFCYFKTIFKYFIMTHFSTTSKINKLDYSWVLETLHWAFTGTEAGAWQRGCLNKLRTLNYVNEQWSACSVLPCNSMKPYIVRNVNVLNNFWP